MLFSFSKLVNYNFHLLQSTKGTKRHPFLLLLLTVTFHSLVVPFESGN